MTILTARDEAFSFTYRANLDDLSRLGSLCFFSPLRDTVLPPCDLLYLPGGYPELFAQRLSKNEEMRRQIAAYAFNGGRVFAECGGFMFLCRALDGLPLAGVFPFEATMKGARLHLGYRQTGDARGHEFHYSSLLPSELPEGVRVLRLQRDALGNPVDTELYLFNNVVGGYTHWYWAEKGFLKLWHNITTA